MRLFVHERTRKIMDRTLVIAYGNPLRSDDGVAWQAAKELKRMFPNSAHVICVHQLTPELAEAASNSDLVIFVDASSEAHPGSVLCQPLSPEPGKLHFSHHLTPQEVLLMCDRLYSAKPRAFLVSVGGKCFDHGEQFSAAAMIAIPRVLRVVRSVMQGGFRAGFEAGAALLTSGRQHVKLVSRAAMVQLRTDETTSPRRRVSP